MSVSSPSPAVTASPLRCVIVDDDSAAIQIIGQCVARTPSLQMVASFTDGHEALAFLRTNPVDVLLLDVEMPLLSGLDLLHLLPYQCPVLPQTVLITSSPDHAAQAFEYSVADYLLKPVSFARFTQAVRKVEAMAAAVAKRAHMSTAPEQTAEDKTFMFIKSNQQLVRVNFADIGYLEANGSYVTIATKTKSWLVYGTLRALWQRLPAASFLSAHRSFVVNVSHIESITESELVVLGKTLPISALLRKNLLTQLNLL